MLQTQRLTGQLVSGLFCPVKVAINEFVKPYYATVLVDGQIRIVIADVSYSNPITIVQRRITITITCNCILKIQLQLHVIAF